MPVSRELYADLLTPVMALRALDDGRHAFLLESVEGGEKWGRYSFVGSAPRQVWTVEGDVTTLSTSDGEQRSVRGGDPLGILVDELLSHRPVTVPGLPPFVGGAVGYLGYDMVRHMERLPSHAGPGPDIPDAALLLTDVLVVFDNLRQTVIVTTHADLAGGGDVDAAYGRACAALDATVERLRSSQATGRIPDWETAPGDDGEVESTFTPEGFCEAVEQARGYVAQGDIIQVVLSQRLTVDATDVDPIDVYRVLRTLNPSPYMFFLRFPGFAIAGSSPEVLVRLQEGVMEVRPIAGTRRRGKDPADDARLEAELRADPKEVAEHVMLLDLGRNDVGRVAEVGTVRVDERMVVERYSHVMHLVSHVSGRVRGDASVADVIRAAFPAGTLSGAPKVRAMEIIEEIEPVRRGLYGGAVGYLGYGGSMDLCIAIRTLLAKSGQIHVQAGAGIVHDSVPESELEETRSKARALLRAIGTAKRAFGRERGDEPCS